MAKYFLFLFALISLLLAASHCRTASEEEAIRETMGELGSLAEEKDKEAILTFVSEDYFDSLQRTKEDIRGLLDTYFPRYQGIVIHLLSTRIQEIILPEAQIETDMAISSGFGKVFRKLVNYYGEYYRFRIKLVKRDSKWLVREAEWEEISAETLFPESVKILKKILPEAFR